MVNRFTVFFLNQKKNRNGPRRSRLSQIRHRPEHDGGGAGLTGVDAVVVGDGIVSGGRYRTSRARSKSSGTELTVLGSSRQSCGRGLGFPAAAGTAEHLPSAPKVGKDSGGGSSLQARGLGESGPGSLVAPWADAQSTVMACLVSGHHALSLSMYLFHRPTVSQHASVLN